MTLPQALLHVLIGCCIFEAVSLAYDIWTGKR